MSSKCILNGVNVVFVCIVFGLWGGLIIGFIIEYYISYLYFFVREFVCLMEIGVVINIIYGLVFGYKFIIVFVCVFVFGVWLLFFFMDMYGVALCAFGMFGTFLICFIIDVYGLICDNVGGIVEMVGMFDDVCEKMDVLDVVGNMMVVIGKGFVIGLVVLVFFAFIVVFVM